MRVLIATIFTLCAPSMANSDETVKIGDWKVTSGKWCRIASSGWQNRIEAMYSEPTAALGRIIAADIAGNIFLGGQFGWGQCDFYYVYQKNYDFFKEDGGLSLGGHEDDYETQDLSKKHLLDFLQNFSVTPELKCVRIDLKNENHKWYSVAKFSSNGLTTALSEFRL